MAQKYEKFSSLEFLLSPFGILRGVAKFFEQNLVKLAGKNRVFDLLKVRPLRSEAIRFCPADLNLVKNDELVVVRLKIERHIQGNSRRSPYKIVGFSLGGYVNLVFFKIFPSQIAKLAVGKEVLVLGHLKRSLNETQIVHPQEIREVDEAEKLPKINLIYPLSGALTQKFVRGKIDEILRFLMKRFDQEKAQKNDWIASDLLEERDWPLFVEALCAVHNFGFEFGKEVQKKGLERLKYDELLAWQLANLLVKRRKVRTKPILELKRDLAAEFLEKLPFEATNAQKNACKEVRGEVLSQKSMLRLLQGDVGAGKTVVALYACLLAVGAKKQACIVVPIAILAQQHFAYFKEMTKGFGVKIEVLTGKTAKKKREKLFLALKSGEIDILVATHAVLEDNVEFGDLGLAVIDEQHRFGVMQRLKLVEKGKNVDVLLMSATPIPRSLMMSFYGEMDVSILDEKPKNRLEIETLVKNQNKEGEVIAAVKRALEKGEKIYWICSLVEENEENDENERVAAVAKHKELAKIFGEAKVGLIHGKMKADEKEKAMKKFKEGDEMAILVATTVIEVGVDVREATIIVIENAENFGLSQLHQLRGRVGRGDLQSYCILLYGKKYGAVARQRLGIMRQSSDGFFIAEEDLKLRGSGEMLGTRQSGMPEFGLADLQSDLDLVKLTGGRAQEILAEKGDLAPKYQALLKLFDYYDCLRIVEGG